MAVFLYFGMEAKELSSDMLNRDGFWKLYIDSPQKYFFNASIYLLPILHFLKEPFNTPEVLIRYGKNLIYHLTIKAVLISVALSVTIVLSAAFTCVVYEIQAIPLPSVFRCLAKTSAFSFACVLVHYVVYFALNNLTIAVVAHTVINILLIVSINAYNYYFTFAPKVSSEKVLVVYIIITVIVSPIILSRLLRKERIV
jgi:hypothetical protein